MISVALDASALSAYLIETLNVAKGLGPVAELSGGHNR